MIGTRLKAKRADAGWFFAVAVVVVLPVILMQTRGASFYAALLWSVLSASLTGLVLSLIWPGQSQLPEAKKDPDSEAQTQPPAPSVPRRAQRRGLLLPAYVAPILLTEPRGGGADPLHRIDGIDSDLEVLLNAQGVFHFDQIASWDRHQIAWIEDQLEGTAGRVIRDHWVEQAQAFQRSRIARKGRAHGS